MLISMTTTSGDDLPRQIEFLYSRNRLNVAISRARCLAVIVASPRLLESSCSTIEQMRLVNALCWAQNFAVRVVRGAEGGLNRAHPIALSIAVTRESRLLNTDLYARPLAINISILIRSRPFDSNCDSRSLTSTRTERRSSSDSVR